MTKYGINKIWLTGSRTTISRCVYEDNGKYFVKWYGKFIEVGRGTYNFYTIEQY